MPAKSRFEIIKTDKKNFQSITAQQILSEPVFLHQDRFKGPKK